MVTVAIAVTDEEIRELLASLPPCTATELRQGGGPWSPVRIRRLCLAALGARNATYERAALAMLIRRAP